jgi:hypothetical protein
MMPSCAGDMRISSAGGAFPACGGRAGKFYHFCLGNGKSLGNARMAAGVSPRRAAGENRFAGDAGIMPFPRGPPGIENGNGNDRSRSPIAAWGKGIILPAGGIARG